MSSCRMGDMNRRSLFALLAGWAVAPLVKPAAHAPVVIRASTVWYGPEFLLTEADMIPIHGSAWAVMLKDD